MTTVASAETLAPSNQEANMSRTAVSHTALSRRTWIALVAADVILFVLANLTAASSSHPGTASNIFFVAFIVGAVLLIALAVVTIVKTRRGATR
jgi:uncharacterized integral membrane protein